MNTKDLILYSNINLTIDNDIYNKIDITKPMWTFIEFLENTNININDFTMNELWIKTNNIPDDMKFELTTQIIKHIGYKEDSSNKTAKFRYYIKSHFKENIDYIFEEVKITGKRNGARSYIKIYMTRGSFQLLLLGVQTQNSIQIHKDLIKINKWFIDYNIKYQTNYIIKKEQYEAKNIIKEKDDKIDILTQQINTLLLKTTDIYNQNIETVTKLIKVEHQNEQTHEKLNILTNKTKDVVNEVEKIVSDIVPKIVNKQLQEHFIIMHDSNAIDTYYIIRTQHRNVTNSIKKLQLKIETLYKLFDTIDYSHPKNLYILLKNYIKQYKLKNKIICKNTKITVVDDYIYNSNNNNIEHKLIKIINNILDDISKNVKYNIDQVKEII